jgi:hypothetical protein
MKKLLKLAVVLASIMVVMLPYVVQAGEVVSNVVRTPWLTHQPRCPKSLR